MRRTALSVLALTGAITVMTPVAARAATGTFTYETRTARVTLADPADGRCYTARPAASGAVRNDTDRAARLYTAAGCRGAVTATIPPGGARDAVSFTGVTFG